MSRIEKANWDNLKTGRLIQVDLHREVSGQCPSCGRHESKGAIVPGSVFIKCSSSSCGQLYEVKVSKKKWVVGDSHTNTIEGFWSLMKGGLRGVYRGRVERNYLQNYINEYSFRYNRRNDVTPMFVSFIQQVRKEK